MLADSALFQEAEVRGEDTRTKTVPPTFMLHQGLPGSSKKDREVGRGGMVHAGRRLRSPENALAVFDDGSGPALQGLTGPATALLDGTERPGCLWEQV
jgi:hypothetical protein